MNNEIIDMAKKCGWNQGNTWDDCMCCSTFDLKAFANLVAKAKAEELATALEKGPINDTAASIAIWIRQQ